MRKSKKKDKRPLKLNKEKLKVMGSGLENNRKDRIRTSGLFVPNEENLKCNY